MANRTFDRNSLIASSYTLSGAPVFQTPRFSFADRVAAAAHAGYDAIGLALEDYAALRAGGQTDAVLRRIADDHGIAIAELEFLTNWWRDGAEGRRARDLEQRCYEAAAAFGARHVNVGSAGSRGSLPPLENVADAFAALCDRAARHQLRVAFEFLPWSDIPDAATANRLIVLAGHPNGGILIDTWHYFRGAADPAQIRAIPPERFFVIQFDDADASMRGDWMEDTTDHRRLPGRGSFDLTGFVRMLDAHGVDAPFSIEVLSIEQRGLPLEEAAAQTYQAAREAIARARQS